MPQGGIPVRAYAGSSAIASGTVTASGSGVTLNVPANSSLNRTVAFQYQWNGTWTTIENRTQVPKPNITLASVSPAGNIPYGGGVYTVTLSGVLPSGGVQVRAITNTVLASGVVTGSGSTCTLTIPANTTVSNRTVTFQYLWNGTWTRIDGRTQLPTPQITKAALSPEGIISGVGEDMYITLWGAIPMNGVNIRARVGTTVVASNVVTGTGKQNAKVLSIPENEGKARDITFEYQFDNRWINIETRQQRGNLILVEFAERVTAPDVKGKCDAKTGYHFMSDEEIDQLWARASEFIVINAENTTEKYGIHTGHYDGYDSFTIHGGGRYGVLLSRRRTSADKCNYVCVKDY